MSKQIILAMVGGAIFLAGALVGTEQARRTGGFVCDYYESRAQSHWSQSCMKELGFIADQLEWDAEVPGVVAIGSEGYTIFGWVFVQRDSATDRAHLTPLYWARSRIDEEIAKAVEIRNATSRTSKP